MLIIWHLIVLTSCCSSPHRVSVSLPLQAKYDKRIVKIQFYKCNMNYTKIGNRGKICNCFIIIIWCPRKVVAFHFAIQRCRWALIRDRYNATLVRYGKTIQIWEFNSHQCFLFSCHFLQFKQLGPTIELGGGNIVLMQEGDTETFSSMTKDNTIVMYADPEDTSQAPTQDTQDWIREVMQHLKR